jgi:serine acetyltransferase
VTPLVAGSESEVQGVNDKLQLAQLEAAFRARLAEEAMRSGATLADPARFDQRGTLKLGRDVFIDANVLFEGVVELGDRVSVGPNCVLRDMTVGADTVIHSNCVLEKSSVGSHCSVGPFARLRPECAAAGPRAYRQLRGSEEQRAGQWLEGEPPHVPGRRGCRREGQRGRRHHLLQLRRREQVAHGDRGWRVHRVRGHARGAQ